MNKSFKIALSVAAAMFVFVVVFTWLKPQATTEYSTTYQHEIEKDADSTTGTISVPTNYKLDEYFKSHLPLVVIDLHGNKIPNVYCFTRDGNGKTYTEEGLINPNPWAEMTISIIDNENNVNSLGDEPVLVNNGLIKLRGMTSRTYDKKQYGIKLMDGELEAELPIMGMEADEDWVLSNSIADLSGIRNYLAMNIGSHMFDYNSDVRFCEVIFKDGDTYSYQGLYLMQEKIKQAEGRVDIDKFDEGAASLSYIVCRDRYDETKLTLSTWASDEQLCYGYYTVVYPNEEALTDNVVSRIESELSQIEYCLYSDDYDKFINYDKYIDVDSFVDYFIINEFFGNYDAGNNSTYYYKTREGKLAIGPLWDYDGCLDNWHLDISNFDTAPFMYQPWFEKLLQDEKFQKKIVERYKELRESILSTEYINEFIDDAMNYLGNAKKRDTVRWIDTYKEKHLLLDLKNSDGILIDRNSEDVDSEVLRIKDAILMHGNWLDKNLEKELATMTSDKVKQARQVDRVYIAIAGIFSFFVMIILLSRYIKGEYR